MQSLGTYLAKYIPKKNRFEKINELIGTKRRNHSFFTRSEKADLYDTVAYSSMHYIRKYEAFKSTIENLRHENVFFELKVKTTIFFFKLTNFSL